MSALIPASIGPAAVANAARLIPALIAASGEQAAWRYIEFFTANIRNPNTRRAYARACAAFFQSCEARGLTLAAIRPHDVGAYVETLHRAAAAPSVKQSLAAIRTLFDWLVVGQVLAHRCAGRSTSSKPARPRCWKAPSGGG